MGFRGEALAAINAIAELSLQSPLPRGRQRLRARRPHRRAAAGGARDRHHGRGARAVLRHAGAAQVPEDRCDRARALHRGGAPPCAGAARRRLLGLARRPAGRAMARCRCARPAAGRCARRGLRGAERGGRACGRPGARGGPRRHSRCGALARRPAVLLRQRPLRARQGAGPRGAQRLRRRAARPAPAGLCALPRDRSGARRRQRASHQDRSALPRRARGAPGGAPRHRERAGRAARRRSGSGRGRAFLQAAVAAARAFMDAAGHPFRRGTRSRRRSRDVARRAKRHRIDAGRALQLACAGQARAGRRRRSGLAPGPRARPAAGHLHPGREHARAW